MQNQQDLEAKLQQILNQNPEMQGQDSGMDISGTGNQGDVDAGNEPSMPENLPNPEPPENQTDQTQPETEPPTKPVDTQPTDNQTNSDVEKMQEEVYQAFFETPIQEFNPEEALKKLYDISPVRVEKLVEYIVKEATNSDATKDVVLRDIFGDNYEEEIKSYKILKRAGIGNLLKEAKTDEDGTPLWIKYDKNGEERSKEEQQILKELLEELNNLKAEKQAKQQQEEELMRQQYQVQVLNQIGQKMDTIYNKVEVDINKFTEKISDESKKESIQDLFKGYLIYRLQNDNEQFIKTVQNLYESIANRDKILESKLTAKLISIVDNEAKTVKRVMSSLMKTGSVNTDIKIDNTSISKQYNDREKTLDEKIQELVKSGKLTL